jgi:hypothetical protein
MRTRKLFAFLAGAVIALTASAATHAVMTTAAAKPKGVKKGTHVNLSPEDYIEIKHLIAEYPRDVDPGVARNNAWMYLPDSHSVGMSGAPMVKPEDYKYFYGSLIAKDGQASKGGNRHFNMSPVIVGLPDGTARGSSYMIGVSIKEEGGKPTIDLMGKYEDIYVKTPDGWKIKERIWTSDSFVGSYQDVAPSPNVDDPRTWTTETDKVIEQLWARGMKRDATGAPIPVQRTPAPAAPERR